MSGEIKFHIQYNKVIQKIEKGLIMRKQIGKLKSRKLQELEDLRHKEIDTDNLKNLLSKEFTREEWIKRLKEKEYSENVISIILDHINFKWKNDKQPTKHPLSGIMRCLYCNGLINVKSGSKGKNKYYICGGANRGNCDSSPVKAKLIEDTIKGIVIKNLKDFIMVLIDDLTITEEEKRKQIKELLSEKRMAIKLLPDGIRPVIHRNRTRPVFRYIDNRDNVIYDRDHRIKSLEEGTALQNQFHALGGSEKVKKLYIEKLKNILNSGDTYKINALYKRFIRVTIDTKEKNGLIYFLLFKPQRIHFQFVEDTIKPLQNNKEIYSSFFAQCFSIKKQNPITLIIRILTTIEHILGIYFSTFWEYNRPYTTNDDPYYKFTWKNSVV